MPSVSQYQLRDIVQDILNQLGLLVRLERKILDIIASYAVAISLFMRCVPIAAKELVSTFAVEPRRIIFVSNDRQ
jgi:putative ABC transport system ATP-binding protein